MKRFAAIILALALLCACGQVSASESSPVSESAAQSDSTPEAGVSIPQEQRKPVSLLPTSYIKSVSILLTDPIDVPTQEWIDDDVSVQSAQRPMITVPELPKMDTAQRALYDTYIRPLCHPVSNSPLTVDFDDRGGCGRAFNPYFLFTTAYFWENGVWPDNTGVPGYPSFPATLVEGLIAKYFFWDTADIRATVGAEWDQERYDAASGTYYFPGGYGGVGPLFVVTGSRQTGDTLEIDCAAYWDGAWNGSSETELAQTNTLTVLTEADGFKIAANRITYTRPVRPLNAAENIAVYEVIQSNERYDLPAARPWTMTGVVKVEMDGDMARHLRFVVPDISEIVTSDSTGCLITRDGTLVFPTASSGIWAYRADMAWRHITALNAPFGCADAPHRLLNLVYDRQNDRFLALHTREFDSAAPDFSLENDVETMILSVYSGDWEPLLVFDTEQAPEYEKNDNPHPGFYPLTLAEPGIVAWSAYTVLDYLR